MKLKLRARLSFPDIWEATQVNGQGKHAYRAQLLIDAEDAQKKKVDDAIEAVAQEKWKAKAKTYLPEILIDKKACCWIDGNRREYDGYEGNFALSAIRYQDKGRPTIVDEKKTPLSEKDGKPYAGCYVWAVVEIWAQDNTHGKAIRCELLGLQFAEDGDAFAGGSKAADADEFEDLSEGADADALA